MDIPKFTEVGQKLSFFKNYSSLLWPLVISLVAVFFLVLSPLMGSKLKKKMAVESVSKGRNAKSLILSAVSRRQSEEEKKYQDAYENDANQIALLVNQSSRRELLSYKIFPEPKDTSMLIFDEFGREFRDALDKLIVSINALDCPTEVELERVLSNSGSSVSRTRRRSRGVGLARSRGRSGYSRLGEIDDMIQSELCRVKAQSASVYGNPVDLSGYEFWEEYEYSGMEEAVEDCWYWQLAYWIIGDVTDTIGAMNSGSDSVFTSSVKRLMSLSFSGSSARRTRLRTRSRSRPRSRSSAAAPHYVRSINDELTESYTTRLCDDDIDVVHFNISVLVRIKDVPLFMQELCSAKRHEFRGFSGNEQEQISEHNQITILKYDIGPIDRNSGEHELYRYGEDAVVKLDLICEYIFNKKGYDEITPKSIKESLKRPA